MPQAWCCEDGIHCCPHSYVCSRSSTCSKGDVTIPATKRLPAASTPAAASATSIPSARRRVGDIIMCPDYRTQCPSTDTCCLTSDEPRTYGCCPVRDAVCCADGKHCCPSGYTCDLSAGTCESYGSSIPMIKKRPPAGTDNAPLVKEQHQTVTTNKPQNIMCNDKKTQCADGNTCCKLPNGKDSEFGCCPMPNATCCSDGIHCCPSTYTCNVSSEICSKPGSTAVPLMKKVQAVHMAPQNIVCPNKETECSDGSTCCQLKSLEYACCPIADAICCGDGEHCCPKSYTCDTKDGTCTKGDRVIAMFKKQPAIKKPEQNVLSHKAPQNVVCPNHESECSPNSTCCLLQSGVYGCCPIADAICCGDGVHCCPKSYTCDTKDGTCTKGDRVIAMFEKQPAIKKAKQNVKAPQNIVCPYQKSECASNATCCLLKSGVYGCCPLPFAVCCKDDSHCCPNDYACQEGTGKCVDRYSTIAMFKNKQPALRREKSGALLTLVRAKNEPESSFMSIVGKSQFVTCPDLSSTCPDGYTCCQNVSGGYGCCPHVKAVCCDDRKHCCAQDYTCDPSSGSCVSGNSILPLSKKIPATTRAPQNIVCPDEETQCFSNNTCCKYESGGYSCCPATDATCCGDGIHCCPSGTTCDLIGRKCRESELYTKLSATSTEAPQKVVCPDKQNECSSNETCCALTSGEDGCCPLSNAVCCGDGKTCCPSGTICDLAGQKCRLPADSSIPLLKLSKKKLSAVQLIYCPDYSYCSSSQTCCELSWGDYGCCSYSNAVCCSDDKSCCPSGTYCDLYSDKCVRNSSDLVVKKQPLLTTNAQLVASAGALRSSNIICPNEQDECSDSSTCCLLSSGQYGCCPVQNAICCPDNAHCCPQGFSCDTDTGTCSKDSSVIPILERVDLRQKTVGSEKLKSVVCPDGKSECPSGSTCCEHSSHSGFGCCPLPNAACCNDGKHCCPTAYKCNVDGGTCTKGDHVIAMFKKQPAIIKNDQINVKRLKNVECPDQKSECPDYNTCCKLESGKFACCPLINAICCTDGTHCCPLNYTCGSTGTCTKGKSTTIRALLTKLTPQPPATPPSSISDPQSNFPCPGQTRFYCRTGQTCCRNSTEGWECCNSPEAVCCSSLNGCCPRGNTCPKNAKGNCIPNVASRYPFLKPKLLVYEATKHHGVMITALVPPTEKQPAIALFKTDSAVVKAPQNVVCPDQKSECGDNSTCCMLDSGVYGCCPISNAECCEDRVHCCPEGYSCNTGAGTCAKGDKVVAMLKKQPAIIKAPQNVVCPDQKSECGDNSTCCMLDSGVYGCCPIPNAECCADKVHCCPEGYSCKTGAGTCAKGDKVVAMLKKQPAIIKAPQNVVCPDRKSECGDSSTCCMLDSGEYGCCPVPNAECCKDGEHCCPEDYSCKTDAGTCVKGDKVVAMLKKQPALIKAPQNIVCPDQKSECGNNSTCCLLHSGEYGCCPVSNAKCCEDRVHCCPQSYECKPGTGTCEKGDLVVAMFKKQPAIVKNTTPPRSSTVPCPDKSTCSDQSTCCKLKSGQYGCCPQPNGVCCDDGVHCCPTGFTCDISRGTCTKGDRMVAPFLAKLAVVTVKVPEGVVKCPDNGYCPDTSTCCLLESGRYGCCPQVNAICCSDKEHCCPQNYTCTYKTKTCNKGSTVVPMLKKLPSFSSPQDAIIQKEEPFLNNESENVICPDKRSECPTNNTCCLTAGAYRCCPGTNAVCCGDRIHCCPEGFTCHVPTKKCMKGDTVVRMLKKLPSVRSLKNIVKVQEVNKEQPRVHVNSPLNVICPDRRSQCPNSNTCCQSGNVAYRCCPTPNAVCCPDQKHCCPKDYACNVENQTCDNVERGVAMPFMEVANGAGTKDDIIEMIRDVL